ncbi:hypothetical protein TNCV_2571471 [Trichonephila clavipes]|nr:hypothetical protein TNCV_2571471 [Trichonephila clavipes]
MTRQPGVRYLDHLATAANIKCSAGLSIGRSGALDKLGLTRFSGYKFRSVSTKGPPRSSAPRARNKLKPALVE